MALSDLISRLEHEARSQVQTIEQEALAEVRAIEAATEQAIADARQGLTSAAALGYPVILKAAHGGGGRGMRIVESADQLADAYDAARRESLNAFGSPDIFIEKFIRRARHIASFNSTWTTTDERLSATLTVRYNGRQQDVAFTDPSFVPVSVTLDDYVLVNLNAEYRLTDGITLFGRVENLFDEDYEDVFSYANPGTAAYGGLRVRF